MDDVQDDNRAAQVAHDRGAIRDLEAQNKRLSDALATRSQELGEAIRRAEKAEDYARAADRRFDIQRETVQKLRDELTGAKQALAAVTDSGTGR